jgi:hypothetical protein
MTTDGIQKLSETNPGHSEGSAWAELAPRERLATYLASRAGAKLAVGQKPPPSEQKVRNRTISQQTA